MKDLRVRITINSQHYKGAGQAKKCPSPILQKEGRILQTDKKSRDVFYKRHVK
jgi:hypothetical protein